MQKISNRRLAKAFGMAFLAVGVQSAAQAVDVEDKMEIHVYGQQNYFQTNVNEYLGADRDGTWDNYAAAILFATKLDEKSKAWVLLHGTAHGVRVDWAFIDYQLTSNLMGRVGKIKKPVGLYNEIRDVQYLHISALQPALYQEASEMVDESYKGVALVYEAPLKIGGLSFDLYGGELDVHGGEEGATEKYGRLMGGRVTYQTPIDGLKFMGSMYNSTVTDVEDAIKSNKKLSVLSADYTANNFDLKAEYADMKVFDEKANTYYLQAAYTFAEKWTPYLRYDYITTDVAKKSDPAHYQKTKTVGVGYKVNDSISVRVENHWNRGYALPVASGEVEAGETDWKMFATSVNFIF